MNDVVKIADIKSQAEAEKILLELGAKLNVTIRDIVWYSDKSVYFEMGKSHFKITNTTIYAGKEFSADVEKLLTYFIETQGRELIGSETAAAYHRNPIEKLAKWTSGKKVDRTIEYLWRKVVCGENINLDNFKAEGKIKEGAKEKANDLIAFCNSDSINFVTRSNGDRSTVSTAGVSLTGGYSRDNHIPLRALYEMELLLYKKAFMKKIVSKEKDKERREAMLASIENSLTRDNEYRVNGLNVTFRGNYVICADVTVDLDGQIRVDGVSFNSSNCKFKEAVEILKDVVHMTSLENFTIVYDKYKDDADMMKFFRDIPNIKSFLSDVLGTASRSNSEQGSSAMGETLNKMVDRGIDVAKSTASASIADVLVAAAIELITEASTIRMPAKNRKAHKAALKDMYRDPMYLNMLKAAIVVCLEALPASMIGKLPFDVKAVSNVLMVDGSRFVAGQLGELATMLGGDLFRKFQDLLSSDGIKALAEGENTNFMGSFVDIKEAVPAR
jgi:hypothetical protein